MEAALQVASGGKIGLGNLWILGWYIFSVIGTGYCLATGASLYGLFIAFQGGDVPKAMDDAFDFCYGKLAEFY